MANVYIGTKVQALREIHRNVLEADLNTITIKDSLAQQAMNLLQAHNDGNDAVTFHLACWSPQFIGKSNEHIMSTTLTIELARDTIAREHGYNDWSSVDALGNTKYDVNFEQAVDQVLTGKVEALAVNLKKCPRLVHQTSQYPHSATLLHYTAANGVESHRQITPLNLASVTELLVDSGADVNAEANMYGGGSTTLGLLFSSAHPANAGVLDEVATILKNAGAL